MKINPSLASIQPIQQSTPSGSELKDTLENQPDFESSLSETLSQSSLIRFSAHAQQRLLTRNIAFGVEENIRLEQAVEKAAEKGSQASLILLDDLALIVSIKNRTVITAIDAESRKENIFTNIDSVVLT